MEIGRWFVNGMNVNVRESTVFTWKKPNYNVQQWIERLHSFICWLKPQNVYSSDGGEFSMARIRSKEDSYV